MVINICVCVGQRPSSAILTHSAENLLSVVVVAVKSNSSILCILGRSQTKLLHYEGIFY